MTTVARLWGIGAAIARAEAAEEREAQLRAWLVSPEALEAAGEVIAMGDACRWDQLSPATKEWYRQRAHAAIDAAVHSKPVTH